MRHLGAGRSGDQRRGARVGEQVEDARVGAAPVLAASRRIHSQCGSCSGKSAEVAEARQPAQHRGAEHAQRPGLRHRRVLAPAPDLAVLIVAAALERRIGPQPHAGLERRPPHGLRLRPVHREAARSARACARCRCRRARSRQSPGWRARARSASRPRRAARLVDLVGRAPCSRTTCRRLSAALYALSPVGRTTLVRLGLAERGSLRRRPCG